MDDFRPHTNTCYVHVIEEMLSSKVNIYCMHTSTNNSTDSAKWTINNADPSNIESRVSS